MSRKSETPLMAQYRRMKEAAPGTILLFRVGDFYETFDEDATLVSRELGITLTKRNNGGDMTPLAGFPFHAVDSYLPKLVRKGYRVAVCEQTEDPEQAKKAGKKIVEREITEIATPGVTLSEHVLDSRRNNYILSVNPPRGRGGKTGVAFADVSTGEFALCEVPDGGLAEIRHMLAPAEVVLPEAWRRRVPQELEGLPMAAMPDWIYTDSAGYDGLVRHFGTHSLRGFGVEELAQAHGAAAALLEYLKETQRNGLRQVGRLTRFDRESVMSLDAATQRNLELAGRSVDGAEEGSLISILDQTRTPMGGRLLRRWVVQPLRQAEAVNRRLDAVQAMVEAHGARGELRGVLARLSDLERLISRISSGRTGPRDLGYLRASLQELPEVKRLAGVVAGQGAGVLAEAAGQVELHGELLRRLEQSVAEEPPPNLRDGGAIRDGFHEPLDELRSMARDSRKVIAGIRDDLVRQTGIQSLKVGYNKVFGYYIEVSKARKEPLPENFIRKQTLVNAERYITPELKEVEERILHAEEHAQQMEAELFEQIRSEVAACTESIQRTAAAVSRIDVVQGLAEVAHRHGYVRPEVDEGDRIEILKGRHPVVERLLGVETPFIPNDVVLDRADRQIVIITGPNMAGKSVILRQTGLIVLLAQAGSFVPAKQARIGLVDKIFTRVGASDNLGAGESTFLVEMNEAASILNNATPRSLILLDEIGRGTSTFDGLSIAWSLAEYLHNEPSVAARTLFATHYHELNELASRYPRIRNANVQVREHEGQVIFLRKLVEGGADHSYGIQVAALAGLPAPLLARAREVLRNLEGHSLQVGSPGAQEGQGSPGAQESGGGQDAPSKIRRADAGAIPEAAYPSNTQMTLFAAELDPGVAQILDRLEACDPERMTPIDALLLLGELKRLRGA